MSPPDPDTVSARRRAILLALGGAGVFTLAAAGVKGLEGGVPMAQLILFRNLFALPILLAMLWQAGGIAALKPRAPAMHALRVMFGMCGMVGAFAGYTFLPLATATVLGFTMPLFLTALSVLLLKERVGWRRWTAVTGGFAGVVIVARPGAGEALPIIPVLLVLLGALGWALAMMTIRAMGQRGERGVTIVLWFAIGSSLLAAVATVPVWVDPTPRQWLLLAGIGVVSAVAQLLMTEAYRRGDTTLLAPFEYSALLWTMLMGGLFWGEWPGPLDLLGFAVLVGAGLFIWWREATLARR
ncbi:DMT family transporter [Falsiroseomonas sp. HW251]|uniref:DMT family transporter n=1 Tax=Falsiroseomonas sp. HW251 TaxID=3390998 RepID=UPI003D313F00